MLCKYCKHWEKKEDFGICKAISASLLTWEDAEKLYNNSIAITTCDKEGIYGELLTKHNFGCLLFE